MRMQEKHQITYSVLCISQSLKVCAESIAMFQERRFEFIMNIEEIKKYILDKNENHYVTLIALTEDVSVEILNLFLEKNCVFGIVSVNDEKSLKEYYKKIYCNQKIVLSNAYIENFLEEKAPIILEERLYRSEVCMFSGHGDYLCFNMSNAILCSKQKQEINGGKYPRCFIENECYRKQRLQNEAAKIYGIHEMQAKILFLNTCSGVGFRNRKYNLNCKSLSDVAMEGQCLVFISNYMIGAYSHEETIIFFAMLVYYKNLALALSKYNLLVNEFYKKPKSTVMVGDASVTAIVKATKVQNEIFIIRGGESSLTFKLKADLLLSTATFEISKNVIPRQFDLLETIQIDLKGNCCYTVGILEEDNVYKLFIYVNSNSECFDTEILFLNKQKYQDYCTYMKRELWYCGNTVDFLFTSDLAEQLKDKNQYFDEKLSEYLVIQDINKGNIEIATFGYCILKKARDFIRDYNTYIMKCFLENAESSDTHLILDSSKLLTNKFKYSDQKCSKCGNSYIIMEMVSKVNHRKYIQHVCPECEIFYISTHLTKNIDIKVFSVDKNALEICLSKEEGFDDLIVGAMIINTAIHNVKQYSCKNGFETFRFDLSLEDKKLYGMYYLRVVILEKRNITIFHTRYFFDAGGVENVDKIFIRS